MKKHEASVHIVSGLAGGVGSVNSGTTRARTVRLDEHDSLIVVVAAAAAAGSGQELSIEQSTDQAGTSRKAVTGLRFFRATHATALPDTVSLTTGDDSGSGTDGDAVFIWVEVTGDQLDNAGGFNWVNARLARTANAAQQGCVVYVLQSGRYQISPEDQPTVLS